MRLDLNKSPIIYLISDGTTTSDNFAKSSNKFLSLVKLAVDCGVSLVQIREKQLTARQIFELATRAARLTKKSQTALLINDRADIAVAARADGVHLTSASISPVVIRQNFPKNFIIGASSHSLKDVLRAKTEQSDFATFSPIYSTPSKTKYGLPPQGLKLLSETTSQAGDFSVIALGGINETNLTEICAAGAAGVAAIRFFNDAQKLSETIELVRRTWRTRHQTN